MTYEQLDINDEMYFSYVSKEHIEYMKTNKKIPDSLLGGGAKVLSINNIGTGYELDLEQLGKITMSYEEFFTKDGGVSDTADEEGALIIATTLEQLGKYTVDHVKSQLEKIMKDEPGDK